MSSKYLKDIQEKKTKIIHVYPNGDCYARATFVLLRLLEQKDLERIIRAIEDKVRLPLNRPIRKLFEMTGIVVKSAVQIEDGKYYVAASAENYMPLEYGHGLGWVMVGPVRTNKYANVTFVSRSEEMGTSKSLNSSNNMLASTKDTIKMTNRKKSPTRRTPASIKKIARQTAPPRPMMVASEHTDPSPSSFLERKHDEVETDGPHNTDNDARQTECIESFEPPHGDHNGNNREYSPPNVDDAVPAVLAAVEQSKAENNDRDGEDKMAEDNNDGHDSRIFAEDGRLEHGGRGNDGDRVRDRSLQEDMPENGHGDICDGGTDPCRMRDERCDDDDFSGDVHSGNEDDDGNVGGGRSDRIDEAATKIQATFRGHRVRTGMDRQKQEEGEDVMTVPSADDGGEGGGGIDAEEEAKDPEDSCTRDDDDVDAM